MLSCFFTTRSNFSDDLLSTSFVSQYVLYSLYTIFLRQTSLTTKTTQKKAHLPSFMYIFLLYLYFYIPLVQSLYPHKSKIRNTTTKNNDKKKTFTLFGAYAKPIQLKL